MTLRPSSCRSLLLAALLPGLILLSAAQAAAGDWQIAELVDPTRDEASPGVAAANERGFRLEIVGNTSGGALAIFRLAKGTGDFLDPLRAPTLRIDDGLALQVLLAEAGLTWAAFPVWNGNDRALTGLLRDLMAGERLEITYFLNGGGYKETDFDLTGARRTIAEAFDIPAEVDAAEVAQQRELEAAMLEEGVRCSRLKGKKRQQCIDEVKACALDNDSAAGLRDCLNG